VAPNSYPSCEWIEGGLAFNRRSLNTCLIVHHHTGLPFIADYEGGPLPLETLLRVREEIRAANRQGGHPECRGCPHLKVKRWPRPRYPIEIVGIAHYAYCNIKCSYCFLQTQDPASFAPGLKPYSILPAIRELIRDGHLSSDAIIDWGGGEPTSFPEFDELLALLLEHGTFHYIHSNGTRFPTSVRCAPRRVHVICSVDAGLPETYVRLKQKDYLERVWRVLEQYVRAGARVSLKYIVKDENCGDGDLEAFIARARRIGANEVIVDIDYDFPVPSPEVIRALGRLRAMARQARIPSRFGFTGANFALEQGVAGRVEEAFRAEWRLRRGGWAARTVRLAESALARFGMNPRRWLARLTARTHAAHEALGARECSDATTQTRADEPGGVGRRLWHLPVTPGDRDAGD
jgi:pyruvate-formate lyase-activating enzyme